MEANRPGVMSTQRKCIRRSQGCMAAQGIFHYRCEPTQVKVAISTGDHKGCFTVTVLRCDFLHDIIGRKCGNEAYTLRIAREQFVREGIDVVIGNWHAQQSITGPKPLTGRLVDNNSSLTRNGRFARNSGMIAILRGHLLTCASVGVEHQSCDYFFRCAPVCDRDEGCGNTSWKCGEDETLAVWGHVIRVP